MMSTAGLVRVVWVIMAITISPTSPSTGTSTDAFLLQLVLALREVFLDLVEVL
jgi:hypothetical protein